MMGLITEFQRKYPGIEVITEDYSDMLECPLVKNFALIDEELLEKERTKEIEEFKKYTETKKYIEEVAREKLDMYSKNERVYININK